MLMRTSGPARPDHCVIADQRRNLAYSKELTERAIDPVSNLDLHYKARYFSYPSICWPAQRFSQHLLHTFFSWLEEMTFLQRFIIFLVAISAALSVSAAPVHVRHLRTLTDHLFQQHIQRRDGDVTNVTALQLDKRSQPTGTRVLSPIHFLSAPRPYPLAATHSHRLLC